MRYAQEKKGQKLHLAFELPTGGLTQPVCGRTVNNYRLTINLPMGQSCNNCKRRLNATSFDEKKFLLPYFQ